MLYMIPPKILYPDENTRSLWDGFRVVLQHEPLYYIIYCGTVTTSASTFMNEIDRSLFPSIHIVVITNLQC